MATPDDLAAENDAAKARQRDRVAMTVKSRNGQARPWGPTKEDEDLYQLAGRQGDDDLAAGYSGDENDGTEYWGNGQR